MSAETMRCLRSIRVGFPALALMTRGELRELQIATQEYDSCFFESEYLGDDVIWITDLEEEHLVPVLNFQVNRFRKQTDNQDEIEKLTRWVHEVL